MNVIKNRLLPSLITIPLLNNTFQNDSSTTQPSFKYHKYNIYLNSNNTFVNRYSRNNFQSSFRTPAFSHNQSRLSTANTVFSLDSSDKTELEPGEVSVSATPCIGCGQLGHEASSCSKF
ncbi:unnamed protein product [Rotaria magnacalcarata]|uniref:CCHC-type domain-containing protein n=1 Tax=Rotaria magnacalcarata TaxID=392030 RepID=A0A816YAX9_9BILA|nr:unnamed protein product [Rotaria magnacalcarata]